MTDTLNGEDGNDQLYLSSGGSWGDKAVLTGGPGADRFVLSRAAADNASDSNFSINYYDRFSPVFAPDRITDFNSAEGDLLRSGITNGLGGYGGNIPLVWRGAAAAGFTATIGQSMALAGSDASDTRFLELWTAYDSASNTTQLFMDRNRDFAVDADDFLLKFTGNLALNTASFTAGTFSVKVGTAGDDSNTTPALGAGDDIAFSLTGNDTLNSLDGDDTVNGDGGNDILSGGLGSDALYGGTGDDTLNGEDGNDQLHGGTGADTLNGGNGLDMLYAEGSRDSTDTSWLNAEAPGTVNILNGGAGDDSLSGSAGDDQLNGDADNDNLHGNDGNDTLNGEDGNDQLNGGSGSNTLAGGAGADQFSVENSIAVENNLMAGGAGNDLFNLNSPDPADTITMTGGIGQDVYKIYHLYPGYTGVNNSTNIITDFTAGENGDVIDISTLTAYFSGNPFDPANGYLRLVQSGTDVLLQKDNDGASASGYTWKTALILKNLDLSVTPLTQDNFSPGVEPYVADSGSVLIMQSDNTTLVTEGGATDIYSVMLTSAPDANVTVTLDNTNHQVNTNASTLTFTPANWNIAQTVTVTAKNDTVGEGKHTGVIKHTVSSPDGSYDAITADSVIVSITDNDLPAADPVFTGMSSNPFGLSNAGAMATPAFADIDGDNDLDVFIGDSYGNTLFSENTGTAGNPAFATAVTNPFGLSDVGIYANPTFADIDGDGDLDAFVGERYSNIMFFRNAGTADNPAFDAATPNPFGLSNVGSSRSSPALVDIDADGDLDAFVGHTGGQTSFFKNIGTATNPAFDAAITNPFGLSDPDQLIISPSFVDIDNDDDLDAFVGDIFGNTLFFRNTGTASNPAFAIASTNPFGLSDAGFLASPDWVDIDGDGDLDAFVGERYGNTLYFKNTLIDGVLLLSTAGNDTLKGTSAANDTVSYVNAAAAVTVSLAITTQQNTIGAGLDTITLIENLTGSDFNDNLTGNTKTNTLDGGIGNDTLNGGTGADTMIGGLGDDNFIIDNAGDAVIENPSEGTDKVSSKLTYTLPAHTENLTLTGALAINGTGNDLANILIGNSAANELSGGGDNDKLDGKAGIDTMIGGLGNDSYVVDNTADVIIEYPAEGSDKVSSSATYALPANVESLTLTGSAAINGTGNSQANTLTGNSGNNLLSGGGGNDKLDGKAGANTLTGGAGKDTFKFTTTGHIDTITDFAVIDDTIQLENAAFTALTATGTLTADKFRIGTQALDANDFVIYNNVTGAILYDADGSGAGAAVQVATVGTGLAMTNADFVVI